MLELNIYKTENGVKTIEKTYRASTYDLMFGTVEDFLNLINVGEATADADLNKILIKNVGKCFDQIKPLLKEVFPGLTDDELSRTKVKEIVTVLMIIFKNALAWIESLSDGKEHQVSMFEKKKTIYQLLFEMNVNICERFTSLNPFDIRRKPAKEVFLLVKRLNEYNRNNLSSNGKKIIRRPASDTWF